MAFTQNVNAQKEETTLRTFSGVSVVVVVVVVLCKSGSMWRQCLGLKGLLKGIEMFLLSRLSLKITKQLKKGGAIDTIHLKFVCSYAYIGTSMI